MGAADDNSARFDAERDQLKSKLGGQESTPREEGRPRKARSWASFYRIDDVNLQLVGDRRDPPRLMETLPHRQSGCGSEIFLGVSADGCFRGVRVGDLA